MDASAMKNKTTTSSMIPDWSLLPEELLPIIAGNLEDCFDLIHARSVCTTWRNTFPFPPSLLRPTYSRPSILFQTNDSSGFERIPLFLFRVKTPATASQYYLGAIGRDKSENHHMDPIQCSVKMKLPRSEPTSIKVSDCHIVPLGYQYKAIEGEMSEAFLPLNKGGDEFVAICNFSPLFKALVVFASSTKKLRSIPDVDCTNVIAFRGRFYASYIHGKVVVIDPYSLKATPLITPLPPHHSVNYLVSCGNEELFLVEKTIPTSDVLDSTHSTCRVSRLNEKEGRWVAVSDLGDRVLFIGHRENFSCSAKQLPDGGGLCGNSIVFTNEPSTVTYPYKYGINTGRAQDNLDCWRTSKENCVTIVNTYSVLMVLRVEH